jgi:hypothetical protein
MKRAMYVGVLAVALLLPTGCSKFQEPFKDAAISQTNDDPATLIRMPDGFSNVAAKCDSTTRVYTVFHQDGEYGSVAVVPNHPLCR